METTTHRVFVSDNSKIGLSKIVRFPPTGNNKKDWTSNARRTRSKFVLNAPKTQMVFSEFQKKLPTYEFQQDILSNIQKNRVTIISAETGSGKSTQIPQYIMAEYSRLNQHCRIVCILPRRLAVKSIAKHVAEECDSKLGETVGYQVRLDDCTTSSTSLIFMTSGCFLRHLMSESGSDFCNKITHVIVDEIHEREMKTDYTLLLLKNIVASNHGMKILLMSATMNTEIFKGYFNNCNVIKIPGRKFKVDIMHLNEIIAHTEYEELNRSDGEIDQNLLSHLIAHIHRTRPVRETILVFLPGYSTISEQKDILETLPNMQNFRTIILHSEVSDEKNSQTIAFDVAEPNERKIVLATNIAESSITIPDLVHVIDCGFAKLMRYDQRMDCKQLCCEMISKASADQRAGRAGRLQDGYCYRLYTKNMYDLMSVYTEPEILRTSLIEVCLNSKFYQPKQSSHQFLTGLIDPPKVNTISMAINWLKCNQMMNADESLTKLGIIAANMPVDCKFVKAVIMAIVLRCQETVAFIVSMLSTKYPFRTSLNKEEQAKINKKKDKFKGDCTSDFFVLFNVLIQYLNEYEKRKFCVENCLSLTAMQNGHGVFKLLKRALSSLGFLHTKSSFAYSSANVNGNKEWLIRSCLISSLYPNVCYAQDDDLKDIGNLNFDECIYLYPSSAVPRQRIKNSWLIYNEKQRGLKSTTIRTIACIPAIIVCLFGGQRLIFDPNNRTISIDGLVRFQVPEPIIDDLFYLRDAIGDLFMNAVENPNTAGMSHEEGRRFGELLNIIFD